jgi:hypothetical protein
MDGSIMNPKIFGGFPYTYRFTVPGSITPLVIRDSIDDKIIENSPPEVVNAAWDEMKNLLSKVMS